MKKYVCVLLSILFLSSQAFGLPKEIKNHCKKAQYSDETLEKLSKGTLPSDSFKGMSKKSKYYFGIGASGTIYLKEVLKGKVYRLNAATEVFELVSSVECNSEDILFSNQLAAQSLGHAARKLEDNRTLQVLAIVSAQFWSEPEEDSEVEVEEETESSEHEIEFHFDSSSDIEVEVDTVPQVPVQIIPEPVSKNTSSDAASFTYVESADYSSDSEELIPFPDTENQPIQCPSLDEWYGSHSSSRYLTLVLDTEIWSSVILSPRKKSSKRARCIEIKEFSDTKKPRKDDDQDRNYFDSLFSF